MNISLFADAVDSFSETGALVLLSQEVTKAVDEEGMIAVVNQWLESFFPGRNRRFCLNKAQNRAFFSEKTLADSDSVAHQEFSSIAPKFSPEQVTSHRVSIDFGGEHFGELELEAVEETKVRRAQVRSVLELITHIVGSRVHAFRWNAELKLVKKYVAEVADNAHTLVLVVNREREIIIFNKALEQLLERPRAKVINQRMEELATESDRETLVAVFENIYEKNQGHSVEIVLNTTRDSGCRVLFSMVPIATESGKVEEVLVFGQDISARKEMEWRIVQAEKLASLGQLAAGVAHEINNPLSAITLYAESLMQMAKMRENNACELEKIQRIKESAARISRFAQELTNYARPSSNRYEEVDVQEVMEEAIRYCEHSMKQSAATIDRSYSLLPKIWGVQAQLVQVFVNLCINACHSLPQEGGQIAVVAQWREGGVEIKVSDTGTGIRDEDLPRIFEPFFSTKPEGRGTGLGLPIVQNIVQKHGGTIHVASWKGKGTTFTIWLPSVAA